MVIHEVVSESTFGQRTISCTEEDVVLFSDASADRSPLHFSHDYARRTPYGPPVVFGCLGAIACLGHVHLPAGCSATSLEPEFWGPMFLGVIYRVEKSEEDGKWRARLFDGSVLVVSGTVAAEPHREVRCWKRSRSPRLLNELTQPFDKRKTSFPSSRSPGDMPAILLPLLD